MPLLGRVHGNKRMRKLDTLPSPIYFTRKRRLCEKEEVKISSGIRLRFFYQIVLKREEKGGKTCRNE
jgi:hypothetical protein